MLHTSLDVGGESFFDIVEFPSLKEMGEEDFGKQIVMTAEALDAAHACVGANIGRWANQGIAGDEYRNYVRAGRPLTLQARS